MMVSANAPSPSLPRKRERGQATRDARGYVTRGALSPAPSPACGGGVGRGRAPLMLSDETGSLWPDAQQGQFDG